MRHDAQPARGAGDLVLNADADVDADTAADQRRRSNAFVLYCLLSGVVASLAGAVASSQLAGPDTGPLVWVLTTLGLTVLAGVLWERVAP